MHNQIHCNFSLGVEFIQGYGWFILLGVIVCLYIKSKLAPSIEKFKQQAEDARAARDYGKVWKNRELST